MTTKLIYDFDSIVISIQTYIFLVITFLKWLLLAAAFFSSVSFIWFDKALCYRLIPTIWFAFFCIHLVAFIQQNTIKSILEVKENSTDEENDRNEQM